MFDRLLNVLAKNLGITIVLVVAAILFFYFSEGLIEGLIAAVAAVIAFTCVMLLYKEYKTTPVQKVKTTKSAKKTVKKK